MVGDSLAPVAAPEGVPIRWGIQLRPGLTLVHGGAYLNFGRSAPETARSQARAGPSRRRTLCVTCEISGWRSISP